MALYKITGQIGMSGSSATLHIWICSCGGSDGWLRDGYLGWVHGWDFFANIFIYFRLVALNVRHFELTLERLRSVRVWDSWTESGNDWKFKTRIGETVKKYDWGGRKKEKKY